MYETTWWGWTRTPEELEKLTKNKWYRFKMNWKFFYKNTYMTLRYLKIDKNSWRPDSNFWWDMYGIWYFFLNFILNRNYF